MIYSNADRGRKFKCALVISRVVYMIKKFLHAQ